jgi:hypothetical protein
MPPRVRNQARCAPLSGKVCLHRYGNDFDVNECIDKDTFQAAYEEKWGGAPWVNTSVKDSDVIVLDMAPASSVTSSATASPKSSRQPTFESER